MANMTISDMRGRKITCSRSCSRLAGNTDFHLHNNYEIYVLLKGDIHYFVEQTCYHLSSGSLLIFNNQEIHKAINLTTMPHERLVIHFDPEYIRNLGTPDTNLLACFQNRPFGQGNYIQLDEEIVNTFISYYEKLDYSLHNKKYGSDLLSLSYLIQLLVLINNLYSNLKTPVDGIISEKLQPLIYYIQQHISDPLTLDEISRALSIDKFYLSHLFKKETGSTIFQYILLKRIVIAKEMLSQGKSVTETCIQSGFNDYTNFIRTFKKITGYSPGKYAKEK
ncbi:MAG: AraC family transcriptional regulator [Lachnospiraceae bacterium]